jgi:hypothetical protein
MKRKLILLALMSMFTVVAVISSCKDDEEDGAPTSQFDGSLSGTITNATAGEIDTIEIEYLSGGKKFPVAANGSFSFTLPTPAAGDLESIAADLPKAVTATPSDAKICYTDFVGYKNGQRVDEVVRRYISGNETTGTGTILVYIYANKDVTVVGTEAETEGSGSNSYSYSYTYNVSLKTGWNIMKTALTYTTNSETNVTTTGNIPSNIPWVLDDY